ncbi:MAG: 16S rRNA (cytidine(1402)-2'-O)-methyltransferase [Bacteroidetes bacterium]|nr:16S rRNA (cytidine(1402)-2'-O)-methyltransferase [Bacteroidota bacterium]
MKLFLIPTPIGNLEDITLRALRLLKEVDLLLAEDTRKTTILLKHFGIEKKMISYNKDNEHKSVKDIVDKIKGGASAGVVTDGGTPGISDPGYLLVSECLKNNIPVETLPGPTAFVPALVNSGLPSHNFVFEGFLPKKKGRRSRLNRLKNEDRTMIFYESPYRLVKTLAEFSSVFGTDRRASVSRELTKMFEETKRGTLNELYNYFSEKTVKGEIVVVVEGKMA